MKKKLSLLMVALVAIAAFAVQQTRRAPGDSETVTFDFTNSEFVSESLGITIPKANSSTYISSPISYSGIKIITFKSTNFPAIFLNQAGTELSFRIYKISGENKGAIEFSGVNEGTTFSKIVMTGDTKLVRLVADKGTITMSSDKKTLTWEGDDVTSVKFTNDNSSNTVRINTISVTKVEASAPAVAAPTISGTTPFIGSTTVTLACDTEGAQIYYTTDGGDPTASDALYAEPFEIKATTTVKAVAVKGDDMSAVATKEFVAIPSVANIAALNALDNEATFAFTGEALVVYQNGKYNYVKDNTGSSLIFGTDVVPADAVGRTIAANWTGKVSIYKNLFEAVPDAALTLKEGEAVAVTYPAVAIDDVKAENVNQVVTLKGVTYTKPEGQNFSIYSGETVVAGYNKFGLEIADPVDGETYDIVGVISRYNDNIQFQPISITRVPKVCPVTVEAADITDGDITAALAAKIATITAAGDKVGNITINLAENGAYTVSASIEAGGNVVINGADGATIDASALTAPFIQMSATPVVAPNELNAYPIDGITINKVTINSLAQSLVGAKNAMYIMEGITIENSNINVSGNKHIIDFQGKGIAKLLSVTNSTLWASDAAKHTGRLYQQQSGKKPAEIGYESLKVSITNSTLYNISNGQNYVGYYCQNSQKWMTFEVLNSVIVNCATSGNFVKSLNQKQPGANSTWNVDGNIFNFNGADTSADEVQNSAKDVVKNSVAGLMTFTDASAGDFNGTFTLAWGGTAPASVGDPRWTLTYSQAPAVPDGNYFVAGISFDPLLWLSKDGNASEFGAQYTLAFDQATKTTTIATEDGKYLQADLTIGETAFGWTVDEDAVYGNNIYTMDGETKKYIGVDENKNLILTTDATDVTIAWGFFNTDYYWAMMAPRTVVGTTDLTGTAEDWAVDTKNNMTLNMETGLWEKTFKLVEVTAEKQPSFKVMINADKTKAYPAEPRAITLADFGAEAQPGIYNITISYNDEGNVVSVSGVKVEPEDIVISAADIAATYGDINEAFDAAMDGKLAKSITINLGEGLEYTVSKSIVVPTSLTINGNGSKIDASALKAPFIQMSATPVVAPNELNAYPIDGITINKVTINSLAQSLVGAKNAMYIMEGITIENSNINVSGNKHIIDFQGKGIAKLLSVTNSTLWASDAAKHTGRLYQQQSGKKPAEIGYESLKVSITNSTLYNISNGQNYVGYYCQNSQKWMTFEVLNSVIVNCATSGNFVKSLNQKQPGANSTWNVDGNIFNFNGADTSADEVQNSAKDVVKNSVAGLMTFTDASAGDFNGSFLLAPGTEAPATMPGDPRWTLATKAGFAIKAVNAEGITITPETTLAAVGEKVYATFTLSEGYELEQPDFVDDNGDAIPFAEGQVGLEKVGDVEKMFIIMPATNVTIKAKASKVYQITLALSQENGNATCLSINNEKPETAFKKEGEKIYLAINPDAGYEAVISVKAGEDDVEVTAEAGTYDEQQYTHFFTMPASAVTVTVTFKSATGINSIAADKMKNATIYNMKGQRVDKAQKGLYIINGRKVVIK